jgi:hypothetical protein
VEYHLERGLRLHTEPEYKSLYSWAINEVDAQGQQIGRDQIPWPWSLYFTATSCVLGDGIDIRLRVGQRRSLDLVPTSDKNDETTSEPEIAQRQVIRVQLRPSDHEDYFRRTTYSMFGTDRAINSFQLDIQPLADPDRQESCAAWGVVSYTSETDFREVTTDDCMGFYLFVKPETFARYVAKFSHGLVDEIVLRVGSVRGFYSEWSPSISTTRVKVLTTGDQQKIILPAGAEFEPPRLGEVGEADLYINRRLEFGKQAPVHSDVVEGPRSAGSGNVGTAYFADARISENGRMVHRGPSGADLCRDPVERIASLDRMNANRIRQPSHQGSMPPEKPIRHVQPPAQPVQTQTIERVRTFEP